MTGRLVVASANATRRPGCRTCWSRSASASTSSPDPPIWPFRPGTLPTSSGTRTDQGGRGRCRPPASGRWPMTRASVDALDGRPGPVGPIRGGGLRRRQRRTAARPSGRPRRSHRGRKRRARFRCCIVVQSPPDADGSVIELVADGTVEATSPGPGNGGFGDGVRTRRPGRRALRPGADLRRMSRIEASHQPPGPGVWAIAPATRPPALSCADPLTSPQVDQPARR